MVDRILILDTETSGLSDTDVAIEVAVALYSVKHHAVLRTFASLMYATTNPAVHINRIPVEILAEAPPAEVIWPAIESMAASAQAVVAHNADFDRRFVPGKFLQKPWVCSQDDIIWPNQSSSREALIKLALAHDLGVSHAHRAAVDVDLLSRLFTRVAELGVDISELLVRGMRPKGMYQAMVSYDDREMAKKAGFRWDAGNKTWTRKMFVEDAEALPFDVQRVG